MRVKRLVTTGALAAAGVFGLLGANRMARRQTPVLTEPERKPSYWMETIPALPHFRPLDEHITVDVAIVGGGFTGLAIGYYLKQLEPSLRVAVLEAQRMGSGASSRNSGGAPSFFGGQDTTDESKRGYELLRSFCFENGLDIDLQENLMFVTLHRSASTADNPFLTRDALRRAIGSPYYESAVRGTYNRLHPGKLISGLIEANRSAGVEMYEHSSVTRVQAGSPVWLHTPRARVVAEQAALATNGYTPGLGYAADRIVPLHHRVIVTRPLTDDEWDTSGLEAITFRVEHGSFFTHTVRGTDDRRFFYRHTLGHRTFSRPDWEISADDVANGQRELLRRYPWLDGLPIDYEWHGITARTQDFWPVSGPLDNNVFLAAGFNGYGVMATHYFGHLLAHQMLGRDHQDLHMLRSAAQHPRFLPEPVHSLLANAQTKYWRMRD